MQRNPAPKAILIGGIIAGTLDLTYAITFSGMHGYPAMRVMQSVATGLLGKAAFDGGAATAAIGVCAHFLIAIGAAAVFWFASRRFKFLTHQAVISGFVFGICVYLVMNFVILPLSAYPGKFNPDPTLLVANLLAHMFLFGLPVALVTRKFS